MSSFSGANGSNSLVSVSVSVSEAFSRSCVVGVVGFSCSVGVVGCAVVLGAAVFFLLRGQCLDHTVKCDLLPHLQEVRFFLLRFFFLGAVDVDLSLPSSSATKW